MFRSYPGSIQRLEKDPTLRSGQCCQGKCHQYLLNPLLLCVTFNMSMKFLQYHSHKKKWDHGEGTK